MHKMQRVTILPLLLPRIFISLRLTDINLPNHHNHHHVDKFQQ
jgi:hypothetical protein